MVAGLSGSLPRTLSTGLTTQGVPAPAAQAVADLPPVGTLFAAFLGVNPIQQLLGPALLSQLPPVNAATLTGQQFFPDLIAGPFKDGLTVVFLLAIGMGLVGAAASLIRSKRTGRPDPAGETSVG
jgi:hypothetical protein